MRKFSVVLRDYIEAPADSVRLRSKGDGSPHTWPLFNKPLLNSEDSDSDFYFTFAVTISFGSTGVTFTPAFTFKPIVNGLEVFVLKRNPDGLLYRDERFEIIDIQNS